MPILRLRQSNIARSKAGEPRPLQNSTVLSGLSQQCGNPGCRSGWMKLWRSRQVPVLDGKWACSKECMWQMTQRTVLHEADQNTSIGHYRHRVPLGLLLLSRGTITHAQLRRALVLQKKAGEGRLGEWLVRQQFAEEEDIARALSAQWNCPVLTAIPHDPFAMANIFPRIMIDTFGVIPLRLAGKHLLYVAFEDRIDRSLVLAAERMLGLKVEAGVMRDAEYRSARQQMMRAQFPKTRLLAAENMRGMIHAFTALIEECKAVRSQIVRVHDYFWLRIWRQNSEAWNVSSENIEDMVCTLASKD